MLAVNSNECSCYVLEGRGARAGPRTTCTLMFIVFYNHLSAVFYSYEMFRPLAQFNAKTCNLTSFYRVYFNYTFLYNYTYIICNKGHKGYVNVNLIEFSLRNSESDRVDLTNSIFFGNA